MLLVASEQSRIEKLLILLVIFAITSTLAGCTPMNDIPPTEEIRTTTSVSPDTTIGFKDPSVPISAGTGLPDTGSTSSEEVDCDRAEELCASGDWACDDIADYCDIGPDDGSELPDDWDWDR